MFDIDVDARCAAHRAAEEAAVEALFAQLEVDVDPGVAPEPDDDGYDMVAMPIPLEAMNGHRLVSEIVDLQARTARPMGRFYRAVYHLSLCPPGGEDLDPVRDPQPTEIAVGELECALGISRVWAHRIVSTAITLNQDCPDVLAGLDDAVVDDAIARMVADTITLVEDPDVRREIQALVMSWVRNAPTRKPVAQVKRKLVVEIIKRDPESVERRREEAIARRDLRLRPNPEDGACDLILYGIAPEDGLHVWKRIDNAARAARATGDERPLNQLRGDIALDLLSGRGSIVACDAQGADDPHTGCPCDCDSCTHTTRTADGACGCACDDCGTVARPTTATAATAGETSPRRTWRTTGGMSARVQIHTDLETYLGLADHPGTVDLFGPVTATEVRRWMDYYAEEPATTIAVGVADRHGNLRALVPSSARLYRGRMAEVVRSIHETRFYPTCDLPAIVCELDHRDEYQLTGQTSVDQGVPG